MMKCTNCLEWSDMPRTESAMGKTLLFHPRTSPFIAEPRTYFISLKSTVVGVKGTVQQQVNSVEIKKQQLDMFSSPRQSDIVQ